MDEAADAWVTAGVFYSLPSAAVARSALEARGLAVQSVGIGLPGVQWQYMVAVGGIELRVPADCETTARALLGEGARPPLSESAAFWARPVWNTVVLILLFPIGLWPLWVRRQRCAPETEAPSI